VAGIQRYFRDELKKSKKDNAFGADYWPVDKWCLERYDTEKQRIFYMLWLDEKRLSTKRHKKHLKINISMCYEISGDRLLTRRG